MENAVSRTDFDGQLWGLELDISREINLRKNRAEFGARLIQIRALLQQKNGTSPGKIGADGLRPAGWRDWLKNNGVPISVAKLAIRLATGHPLSDQRRSQNGEARFRYSLRQLMSDWKDANEDDKRRLSAFIRERALEERGGVHVVG